MKSGKKKKYVTDKPRGFRELVCAMPDEFFDGHTDFRALNPEQKLAWLSAGSRFVCAVKEKKISSVRKLTNR
jgi:hypothetical protein